MATRTGRARLIERIVDLAGADVASLVDAGSGWPGWIQVKLGSGWLPVALHGGPVGLSKRERDEVERRFQNPGKGHPVVSAPPALSLLIGLWEEGSPPVLVGMDAERRAGKPTRQSLFVPLWLLQKAQELGWAEHQTGSKELIIAFHPALLPTYVELRKDRLRLPPEQVARIVEASGLDDGGLTPPAERARRATTALLRSQRFRNRVIQAYGGLCALCGLDLQLVEAAHIHPVQAPSSPEEVWNGLALCGNHHTAFDRHYLWVDPATRAIQTHPEMQEQARRDPAMRAFVATTFAVLQPPSSPADAPRAEMFELRYRFFDEGYRWARGE